MSLKRILIVFLIISGYCVYGQMNPVKYRYLNGAPTGGDNRLIPVNQSGFVEGITPVRIAFLDTTTVSLSGSILNFEAQLQMLQRLVNSEVKMMKKPLGYTPSVTNVTIVPVVFLNCTSGTTNKGADCWVRIYGQEKEFSKGACSDSAHFSILIDSLKSGNTYTINQVYTSYYVVATNDQNTSYLFSNLNKRLYNNDSPYLRIGNNTSFYPKKYRPLVFKTKPYSNSKISNNYLPTVSQLSCEEKGAMTYIYNVDTIVGSMPGGGLSSHMGYNFSNFTYIWQKMTNTGSWQNCDPKINGKKDIFISMTLTPALVTPGIRDTLDRYRRIVISGGYADTSNTYDVILIHRYSNVIFGSLIQPTLKLTESGIEENSPVLRFKFNYPSALSYYSITDTDFTTKTATTYTTTSNYLKIPNTQNSSNHVYAISAKFNGTCPITDTITINVTPPDGDGNIYPAVQINNQYWMMSNLRAAHFNDGTEIKTIKNADDGLTAAYSWYNNDSIGNAFINGALYNETVIRNNGQKNVCPVGWHSANLMDWWSLLNYLGGPQNAGNSLKLTGAWGGSGNNGSNSVNFNATPGGMYEAGNFTGKNSIAAFWGIYDGKYKYNDPQEPVYIKLVVFDNRVNIIKYSSYAAMQNEKRSIRCIKD